MNLNELSYVAALAAGHLYPEGAKWESERALAAHHIRLGLYLLEQFGWTFTATEPEAE